jgi:rare lipoprotein A
MQTSNNPARGNSRTALALLAATVLIAGSTTGASAHRYHHHHHYFHRHHHHHASNGGSWRNANAMIVPSSGSGRSFSWMASF